MVPPRSWISDSPTTSLAAEEIPELYQLYHTIYGPSQDEPRPMQDKLDAFARAGVTKLLVCAAFPVDRNEQGGALFSSPQLMVITCPTLAWKERAGNPWTTTLEETPFLEPDVESWDAVVASIDQDTRNASVVDIGKRAPALYHEADLVAFLQHGILTSLVATPSRYAAEDDPYMEDGTYRCLYMSVKDAWSRMQHIDLARNAIDHKDRSKTAAVVLPFCVPLPTGSALPVGFLGEATLGFKNFRQLIHNQYGKHVAATLDTALIREWIELAAAEPGAILTRWFYSYDKYREWFLKSAPWKEARYYHLLQKAGFRMAGRKHIDALQHARSGATKQFLQSLAHYDRISKASLDYLHDHYMPGNPLDCGAAAACERVYLVKTKNKGLQAAFHHFWDSDNVPEALWQLQPCELPAKMSAKTAAPIIGKSKTRHDPDVGVGQAAPAELSDASGNESDGKSRSDTGGQFSDAASAHDSDAKPPAKKKTRFASQERTTTEARRVSHSTAKPPRSQLKDPPAAAGRERGHESGGRERERDSSAESRHDHNSSQREPERERGRSKQHEPERRRDSYDTSERPGRSRRKSDRSASPEGRGRRERDGSAHPPESNRDKQSSRRNRSPSPPRHRGRRERSESQTPPEHSSRGRHETESSSDRGRSRKPTDRGHSRKPTSPDYSSRGRHETESSPESGRSRKHTSRRHSERRTDERDSMRDHRRHSRRSRSESPKRRRRESDRRGESESPQQRRRDSDRRGEHNRRSRSGSSFRDYGDAPSSAGSTRYNDSRGHGRRHAEAETPQYRRGGRGRSHSLSSNDGSVEASRRRSTRHNESSPYDSRRRERDHGGGRSDREQGRGGSRRRGRSRSRSRSRGRGRSRSRSSDRSGYADTAYFRNSPPKRSSRDWYDRVDLSFAKRALDVGALLRDEDPRVVSSKDYEHWGVILTMRPHERDRRRYYLRKSTRHPDTVSTISDLFAHVIGRGLQDPISAADQVDEGPDMDHQAFVPRLSPAAELHQP